MTTPNASSMAHFVAVLLAALTLGSVPNAIAQSGNARVETDPERGQTLYRSCQACHGAAGEGSAPMNAPRLAGQHPWYLQRQLDNFRMGRRGGEGDTYGSIMAPMAQGLPDAQAIRDVVSYIATF